MGAYLPSPEKVARHVHRVHASHDKLLDTALHVLCPMWPVIPWSAVSKAGGGADVLKPLAALEESHMSLLDILQQ